MCILFVISNYTAEYFRLFVTSKDLQAIDFHMLV